MVFWHWIHSDGCFFEVLIPELYSLLLLESELYVVRDCHATCGHRKTTIFTSTVYGFMSSYDILTSYGLTANKLFPLYTSGDDSPSYHLMSDFAHFEEKKFCSSNCDKSTHNRKLLPNQQRTSRLPRTTHHVKANNTLEKKRGLKPHQLL